jgi:uncharacterized protein YjeT (DUF2065 family)
MAMDYTGWSAVLLGLYTLFAGIGALRNPRAWQTMIEEVNRSPALQLLCGLLELLVGALVYLANPWVPADLLSCVMKAMGGVMMLEALVLVAFCDIYSQFWVKNLTHMYRGWAMLTVALGLALTVAGGFRFH